MSKKDEQKAAQSPFALNSPPSHPTTLGRVWAGETRASAETLADALAAQAAAAAESNQPRGG